MQCSCFWICNIVVGNAPLLVPKGTLTCARVSSWYSIFESNVIFLEGKPLCNFIAINAPIIVLNENLASVDFFYSEVLLAIYLCLCYKEI